MPIKTDAVGKEWPAVTYQVGREKIKEYATALGLDNPVHFDVGAAREAGFRDVVAPPMFAVVYSGPALGPVLFDPEVEMNFAAMVHGGQVFEWGEPVCSGDEISTTPKCLSIEEKGGKASTSSRPSPWEPERRPDRARRLDQHRQGSTWLTTSTSGDEVPELRVTPDKYLPLPLRRCLLGDFNPIHIDDAVRESGRACPRNILHGLYSMGLVTKANAGALAGGDPRALKKALGPVPRHRHRPSRRSSSSPGHGSSRPRATVPWSTRWRSRARPSWIIKDAEAELEPVSGPLGSGAEPLPRDVGGC